MYVPMVDGSNLISNSFKPKKKKKKTLRKNQTKHPQFKAFNQKIIIIIKKGLKNVRLNIPFP